MAMEEKTRRRALTGDQQRYSLDHNPSKSQLLPGRAEGEIRTRTTRMKTRNGLTLVHLIMPKVSSTHTYKCTFELCCPLQYSLAANLFLVTMF